MMIVDFVATDLIHPIETDDESAEVLQQTAAHLLNKLEDHEHVTKMVERIQ